MTNDRHATMPKENRKKKIIKKENKQIYGKKRKKRNVNEGGRNKVLYLWNEFIHNYRKIANLIELSRRKWCHVILILT